VTTTTTTGAAPGGLRAGAGGPQLLHDLLDDAAGRCPDRVAVRRGPVSFTYAELRGRSRAAAHRLTALGVRRGDRVAIVAPHDPHAVAAIFGTSRAGALHVVLGDGMPEQRLAHILADCSPRLLLTGAHCPPKFTAAAHRAGVPTATDLAALCAPPDAADPPPDAAAHRPLGVPIDPVGLIYTSGSTALPKAVVSTHRQVLFATQAIARCLGYRRDDTVFCCMPLSFDYGQYQIYLAATAGATLVLGAAADAGPRLASVLRDERVTVLPAVPSLADALAALLRRPRSVSNNSAPLPLRLLTSSGAVLSSSTAAALRAALPGLEIVGMFGLTECKRVAIMEPDGDLARPGAAGRALPGTEIYVVDEYRERLPAGSVGELVVRGEHVMAGYWEAPELTAERFGRDGFGQPLLYTGDQVRLDDEGYLYFVGRSDEVYKQRGFRVSAVEVEAAALTVPGVVAAAVLPPAQARGAVLAIAGDVRPAAVLTELGARLEDHQVPERCVVHARLPLGATGKVDKRALARLVDGGEG